MRRLRLYMLYLLWSNILKLFKLHRGEIPYSIKHMLYYLPNRLILGCCV